MAESSQSGSSRPRGSPWLIAAGFLLAFAATIVTVVLTGLFVRAPRGPSGPPESADTARAVAPLERDPAPAPARDPVAERPR